MPGATFTKQKCAIEAVNSTKEGMSLQSLGWCGVECTINHKQDVHKE